MKEVETLTQNGYVGIITYDTSYDNTIPASRRYGLKIIKDNKIYIERRNGLTLSGAKTHFERWVVKKN